MIDVSVFNYDFYGVDILDLWPQFSSVTYILVNYAAL